MSITQHEARQRPAMNQHHPLDQRRQTTQHTTLGLAVVALAIVPAAFWGFIAWLLWGGLAAAIATIVVAVVSTLMMGLLRSASEIDTPRVAPWPAEWRQAA